MINIDGYRILTKIYESVNSIIYQGIQELDQQPVILKTLKDDYPSPQELIRYQQEYQIICHLDIPGVIKAYHFQEVNRTPVIIFEDFGGHSLRKLLENRLEGISVPDFLDMAIQITEILGHIHHANIIHKDINPGNIIVNLQTDTLKIIDFGISTQLSRENPTLKNPHILEGTLAYISYHGKYPRILVLGFIGN